MSSASLAAPFFIIGPGRSGNTLLRRLLVEQTNACIPDEIYAIGDIIRLSAKQLPWNAFVERSIDVLKTQQDGDLLTADFDGLRRQLLGLDNSQHNAATFIASFYEHECRAFGKPDAVVGDKTPLNTFSALDLARIFSAAKFVFMLRFPVDVVSSYVEAGLYSRYAEAIDRVQRSYAVYRRMRGRPEVMLVCYEDLVKNTNPVMDQITRHLGLSASSSADTPKLRDVDRHTHHDNVNNAVSRDSIGKGLANMPQREVVHCADLVDQYFSFLQAPAYASPADWAYRIWDRFR